MSEQELDDATVNKLEHLALNAIVGRQNVSVTLLACEARRARAAETALKADVETLRKAMNPPQRCQICGAPNSELQTRVKVLDFAVRTAIKDQAWGFRLKPATNELLRRSLDGWSDESSCEPLD